MKVQAFFSNRYGDCRLCIAYPDGHNQHVFFETVSSLLNYLRETNIDLVVSDCITEY